MSLKKTLSYILVFGTLISCVAAFPGCKKNDGGEEETTSGSADSTQTESPYLDNLPNGLYFDGVDISFLIAEPSANKGGTFSERSICLEDYTYGADGTSKVDENVYNRNMEIKNRLGVNIVPKVIDNGISQNAILTSLQAGDSEFDIVCAYQAMDISLALQGLVLNLNDLDSFDADYIDISQKYWSKNYSEALSYNKKMYWITGDLSLRYLGGMYCTFVNQEIYNNNFANDENYGSIYNVVDNGKWTLETLRVMSKAVFRDVGDTTGEVDENDIVGLVVEKNDMLDGMSIGAGVIFSEKDKAGNISIALSNSEKNQSAYGFINEMNRIFTTEGSSLYIEKHNHSQKAMTMFAKGKALFVHDKIYQAEVYLTTMEGDAPYAIIPSPKLNDEQENYRAGIHDGCTLFGIYYNSDSIPAAAATLEAMAAASYKTVSHSYYDEALKFRYSKDQDSSRMIDLIRDSVYIDFAFGWGRSINNIHNFFRDAVEETARASTFRAQEKVWNSNLAALLTALT